MSSYDRFLTINVMVPYFFFLLLGAIYEYVDVGCKCGLLKRVELRNEYFYIWEHGDLILIRRSTFCPRRGQWDTVLEFET